MTCDVISMLSSVRRHLLCSFSFLFNSSFSAAVMRHKLVCPDNIANHSHTHSLTAACSKVCTYNTHTHPFNGPYSGTTWVSHYQKCKNNMDFTEARDMSGNGISWAICKSASRSRQITMPAPHHSVFYRPDALTAAQLTASKH